MASGLTGLKSLSEKQPPLPRPNSKSQPTSFVEREPIVSEPKLARLLQIIHSLSTGVGLGFSQVTTCGLGRS